MSTFLRDGRSPSSTWRKSARVPKLTLFSGGRVRKLLLIMVLLGMVLLGLPCWAQNDSGPDAIEMGAKLKLGMSQQEVLKEIGKQYEAKQLSDPNQFVVFSKPAEGEKPHWEGMLTFKAGKLVSVERLWAYQNDDNSVALAKSLVGVLSSWMKEGASKCTVESLMSDAPDATGETVFLNCGKRSLKISVAKVEGYKEDASVSEVLGQ
jgi:hypothetical protein